MDRTIEIYKAAAANTILQLLVVCVVLDTVFGVLRAIKEHSFNSNFGIDGAIRKVAMMISITFLVLVDGIVSVNLIGFIPEEARTAIGLERIGTMEFFGILYGCYEVVSILKNMALCGLPVKRVWIAVRKALGKYTNELPDESEGENENEREGIISDKKI